MAAHPETTADMDRFGTWQLADFCGRSPALPARADQRKINGSEGVSFSVGRGSVSPESTRTWLPVAASTTGRSALPQDPLSTPPTRTPMTSIPHRPCRFAATRSTLPEKSGGCVVGVWESRFLPPKFIPHMYATRVTSSARGRPGIRSGEVVECAAVQGTVTNCRRAALPTPNIPLAARRRRMGHTPRAPVLAFSGTVCGWLSWTFWPVSPERPPWKPSWPAQPVGHGSSSLGIVSLQYAHPSRLAAENTQGHRAATSWPRPYLNRVEVGSPVNYLFT